MSITESRPGAIGRRLRRALPVVGILAALLVAVPEQASGHGSVPPGFEDVVVAQITTPMDLAWTPDGRLLVPSKGGELWVIDGGTVLSTPAIDLSAIMCTNVERGLGGAVVHPDFATNNFVYLYYTYAKFGTCDDNGPNAPVNRLSRFVLPPSNVIDPASELVLMDTPPAGGTHHYGGDLEFGPDGFLYATIGDAGHRFRADDPDWLVGKIVRLTDDGDIPVGNAFSGPGSARCNVDGVPPAGSPPGTACQEVYSLGLRNPFRFALDSNSPTTRFFINDVGATVWEEIDELTGPGVDYGWPTREGPCEAFSGTECDPDPAYTDPVHWYQHGPTGGAVTGGAFVPDGLWPAEFEGTYLYADYVLGHIYRLEPGGPDCRLCDPPTSAYLETEFMPAERIVEMAFGPHNGSQALFYVSRLNNEVRRVAYIGSANRLPSAVATATPAYGPVTLSVAFDGTGSTDPDPDTLTYEWDFDDGSPVSTLAAPNHDFPVAGVYNVSLTVDDQNGGIDTTIVRVDAGNLPPTPVISNPTPSHEFYVGEVITLTGSATDPEDGLLDDVDLTWEVRQHHNTHFHPYLDPTTGNNIDIVGLEPEDLLATTNSHLEILLTATDSWGLSATVSQLLMPNTVDTDFESNPSGLDLVINGQPVTTPSTEVTWEGWELDIEAPHQFDGGGNPYSWTAWSDGGSQTHDIVIGASPATYTAGFVAGSTILPGSPSVTEGDAGAAVLDVPVTLSLPSTQTITADWRTVDWFAEAPDDFVDDNGIVTFDPGETEETVSVTINGDITHEPDEVFVVALSNPTNATIGGLGGLGFITITNDDPLPAIKASAVAALEGTGGSTVHHIPVNLSHPSSTTITVDWDTVDAPSNPFVAASGSDYVGPASGTVTFAPGEIAQTMPITIIGDAVDEPPLIYGEWGFVQLSNPSVNATIDPTFFGLGLFLIVDDD